MLLFRKSSKWIPTAAFVVAGIGVLGWSAHELRVLTDLLNDAFPIRVMTGQSKMSEYIYLPDDACPPALTDGDSDGQWTSTFSTADGDDTSWKPIASRTPWELLSMTRSEDERHRQIGLKLLASLQNLDPSLCRQIAQATDHRTALSLARSSSADLNMLLPPPPLPSDMAKTEIMFDLRKLLAALPLNAAHKCLQYFTSVALKEIYFQSDECEYSEWWHGGSETTAPIRQRTQSQEAKRLLYLRALLEHSTVPANRRKMVDSRGLQVLIKLYQSSAKRLEERSLIAQIIGNLALDETCREKIFRAGWITILAQWSRSTQLDVSLSASRALANLSSGIALEDGLYLAHPIHWDTEPKILGDIVFVHGLLGGAFKTWRQDCRKNASDSSTSCWPKDWLAHDCPHVRVFLVDYETRLTEWSRPCPYDSDKRTLEARSAALLQKLLAAGVGCRPVIWVAHSMGGLLVKNILLHSDENEGERVRQLGDNTKGIVFYSVPHRGSSMASFHLGSHHVILPSPELAQLRQGSEQLVRLHERFSAWIARTRVPCLSFCEQNKTTVGNLRMSAIFVSKESAEPGFGDFHSVDTDHVYVCKPSDRLAFVYLKFADFVHGLVDHSLIDELRHPVNIESEDRLRFVLSASFT